MAFPFTYYLKNSRDQDRWNVVSISQDTKQKQNHTPGFQMADLWYSCHPLHTYMKKIEDKKNENDGRALDSMPEKLHCE